MPRTRPSYPPEFREQIVALWRSGRSVGKLAAEFEPCEATIKTWVRQAERNAVRRVDSLGGVLKAGAADSKHWANRRWHATHPEMV